MMEKLKKFSENPIWRLAIDIAQLTGVSLLALLGSLNILKIIKGFWFIFFLLIFMLVIVWVIKRFKDIFKMVRNEKTNLEGAKIQKNLEKDFIKGIPSNRVMKSWFDEICEKAYKWDSGADLTSLNLYLKHGYGTMFYNPTPSLQAFYYSSIKNLQASFYVPSTSEAGPIYEEEPFRRESADPFFVRNPRWREALKKAYQSINDVIPSEFEVQISDGGSIVNLTFRYHLGKVQKKTVFSYDGVDLSFTSGKKIRI